MAEPDPTTLALLTVSAFVVGLLALFEEFAALPGAAVACASALAVFRRRSRPSR